jgi:hypothetical protein
LSLAVHEGKDRAVAARIGRMERPTLRNWVHRFNEQGPTVCLTIIVEARSRA